MAESLNTGLSPQQVLTAFNRALNDYTDTEIDTLLSAKQDALAFDSAPTEDSTNPVTSGGVKTALAGKQDSISDLSVIRSGAAAGATAVQQTEFETDQARQETEIGVVANAGAKNLFKNTAVSKTYIGVVFTVNEDGTVSLSGAATTATGVLQIGTVTPPAGSYIVSGCPAGGSWSPNPNKYRIRIAKNGAWLGDETGSGYTVIVNGSDVISLQINSGVGVDTDGLVFKPMIRPASITDPTFQPYALPNPVITPALIEQVDEGAKNFVQLGFTSTSGSSSVPATTNNNDGTITVNGSRVGNATILVQDLITSQTSSVNTRYTLPAGNYVIAPTGNSNIGLQVYKHDGTNLVSLGNAKTEALRFSYSDTDKVRYPYICISLYCDGDATINNFTFMPMVCTAADYAISPAFVPYRPSWQEMWEMIQALQSGS